MRIGRQISSGHFKNVRPSSSATQHTSHDNSPILTTMKSLAAGTLFRAALASSYIFGFIIDPRCAPCFDGAIARGPGAIESKAFAQYLCMGSGGSDAVVCISMCGAGIGDVAEESYVSTQLNLLMGSVSTIGRSFSPWKFDVVHRILISLPASYRWYPQDTCAVYKGFWGGKAIVKVCSSSLTGNGGAKNQPSATSARDMPAGRTSAATTIRTAILTGTSSAGSPQNRTPSDAATVGALAIWEILIGLALLAGNI